ncbi:MAG: nicotinamide-nucleotide amidohydrolase family protein [Clostridia bacterium]
MILIYSANTVCDKLFNILRCDCLDANYQCGGEITNSDCLIIVGEGLKQLNLSAKTNDKLANFYISTGVNEFVATANSKLPLNFSFETYNEDVMLIGDVDGRLIITLPQNVKAQEYFYQTFIKKILLPRYGIAEISYFKLFGLTKQEVESKLSGLACKDVIINTYTNYLDTLLSIAFTFKITTSTKDVIISKVVKQFEEIYCLENRSLQSVAVNLLTLKGKLLSLAESVTGGLIASSIVEISGASKVLTEGLVTYSNKAKHDRLDVSNRDLLTYSAVSTQVAEQMASGLMTNSNCDYALSITGYAEMQNNIDLLQGLCYICITNKSGKKQVYNITHNGDRNTIRKKMANTALFLLIKYIKIF